MLLSSADFIRPPEELLESGWQPPARTRRQFERLGEKTLQALADGHTSTAEKLEAQTLNSAIIATRRLMRVGQATLAEEAVRVGGNCVAQCACFLHVAAPSTLDAGVVCGNTFDHHLYTRGDVLPLKEVEMYSFGHGEARNKPVNVIHEPRPELAAAVGEVQRTGAMGAYAWSLHEEPHYRLVATSARLEAPRPPYGAESISYIVSPEFATDYTRALGVAQEWRRLPTPRPELPDAVKDLIPRFI